MNSCVVGKLYFCKVPGGYYSNSQPDGVVKVLEDASSYRTQEEAHKALAAAYDLHSAKYWGTCWTFGVNVEALYTIKS
jgi:hypothetical protein